MHVIAHFQLGLVDIHLKRTNQVTMYWYLRSSSLFIARTRVRYVRYSFRLSVPVLVLYGTSYYLPPRASRSLLPCTDANASLVSTKTVSCSWALPRHSVSFCFLSNYCFFFQEAQRGGILEAGDT